MKFLDTRQAASHGGLCDRTRSTWRRQQVGSAYFKPGRAGRYALDDLNA